MRSCLRQYESDWCGQLRDNGSFCGPLGITPQQCISITDFFKWNPRVNTACTNLQLGAYACTGVIGGGSSSPSPVTTPTPTQAGMVQGCTAFATVRPTTTCQGILDWNKITLANFVKWNPAVRSDCSNLWSGTWACIAGP
ncbi:LysM domain-containing protein [Plectosphaerella plurivora]|uniref:LysM domain-containing protein n=1 Tax=Plectosphaerella plurivora TaxID=936078 RepID=A0A9P9ABQ2_9PEZI|nr:LysM domain-containing protein [Plectosphaerella plurivora]